MADQKVKKYLLQHLAAIQNLSEQHPKLSFSLLILIYCGIDQFAWLNTSLPRHGENEFKEWAEKYMLFSGELNCTAEELYAARNGIFHMGTSESVKTRNGVQKLGYNYGPQNIPEFIDGHKMIRMDKLVQMFMIGAMRFISDLESNSEKNEIAENKLNKVLIIE